MHVEQVMEKCLPYFFLTIVIQELATIENACRMVEWGKMSMKKAFSTRTLSVLFIFIIREQWREVCATYAVL